MSGTCSEPQPTDWHLTLGREAKCRGSSGYFFLSLCCLRPSLQPQPKRQQSHSKMLYPHPYEHPAHSRFAPIDLRGRNNPLWSTVIPSFQSIGPWTRLLSALLWRWLDKATAGLSHRRAASSQPSLTRMVQEERRPFKIKHTRTSALCVWLNDKKWCHIIPLFLSI